MSLRVDKLTKAALDIFAAKEYARTGDTMTNDMAILRALELADPEAVNQARTADQQGEAQRRGEKRAT